MKTHHLDMHHFGRVYRVGQIHFIKGTPGFSAVCCETLNQLPGTLVDCVALVRSAGHICIPLLAYSTLCLRKVLNLSYCVKSRSSGAKRFLCTGHFVMTTNVGEVTVLPR